MSLSLLDEKESREVQDLYMNDQTIEMADRKRWKKRNLGDPNIAESTPCGITETIA